MCDKFFRREDSSDLLFSLACGVRRNTHLQLQWHVNVPACMPEQDVMRGSCRCVFLRAQCSENMFRLSSEWKNGCVAPSILSIRSFSRRIRAHRSKIRLVSKSGIELCSPQILLGVDTNFVHDCKRMLTSWLCSVCSALFVFLPLQRKLHTKTQTRCNPNQAILT